MQTHSTAHRDERLVLLGEPFESRGPRKDESNRFLAESSVEERKTAGHAGASPIESMVSADPSRRPPAPSPDVDRPESEQDTGPNGQPDTEMNPDSKPHADSEEVGDRGLGASAAGEQPPTDGTRPQTPEPDFFDDLDTLPPNLEPNAESNDTPQAPNQSPQPPRHPLDQVIQPKGPTPPPKNPPFVKGRATHHQQCALASPRSAGASVSDRVHAAMRRQQVPVLLSRVSGRRGDSEVLPRI